MSVQEVKLSLKDPIISYDGKPIKDSSNFATIAKDNPGLSEADLVEKCPNVQLGKALIQFLLTVPSEDNVEKLKLFRWASKMEDKLVSDKAELTLDLNQVTELLNFVNRVKSVPIISIAPVLIILDNIKNQLK